MENDTSKFTHPNLNSFWFAIVFVLVAVASASAQNSYDIGTPAESKAGQSTASTYAMDKIETVNLANGNRSVHIPLYTIGGRGDGRYHTPRTHTNKQLLILPLRKSRKDDT